MNSRLQIQMKTNKNQSFTRVPISFLQRKIESNCQDEDSRKKRKPLRRKTANYAAPSKIPPMVHETLRSPGQPLDSDTRSFMESRFGHDFRDVRVHNDAKAAESTRAVNALAYTVGQDIVFGAGQHTPETSRGQKLMAHELTHVVQQARKGANCRPEQCADVAATNVIRGEVVSPALLGGVSGSLQMKPDDQVRDVVEVKPTVNPNSWLKTLDKFTHNNAVLTRENHKAIDALAAQIASRIGLVAGAKATIAVTGHTDTSGDEKYNEGLGLGRANAAKVALEAALRKKKVGGDRIAAITTESAGEKHLAKETPDNTREPLNRRVEITVKITGRPSAVSTTPATPSPRAEPQARKKIIDLNLPPGYQLPEEDWWQRTERERRKIEEIDRTHPRKPKSPTDVLVEAVTKVLEPIIKQLPKGLGDMAREGIRKGIEAGTEKGCEAAIDASGVMGEEAEALKAACKAALKTKPGEKK